MTTSSPWPAGARPWHRLSLGPLEPAYRTESLAADIAQARVAVAVTAVAILAANLGDLWLSGGSPAALGRIWEYGGPGTLSLVVLAVLPRVTRPAVFDRLLLAWVLAYGAVALWFRLIGVPVMNEAGIALVVFGCYVLLPQRLLYRFLPALLVTAGDLWLSRAAGAAEVYATGLVYGFIHVAGGWAAVARESDRRHRFLAHRGEIEARAELERLANTDALTGTLTRRRWLELAEAELSRYGRHQRPFAILMADLDHFKRVNDAHGHLVGDAVLRRFAELLHRECRRFDLVGRLGGEEFGVLLPETGVAAAREVAERIVAACHSALVRAPDAEVRFTCSIGVAGVTADDTTVVDILDRADEAMYAAKRGGRDRVAVAGGGGAGLA